MPDRNDRAADQFEDGRDPLLPRRIRVVQGDIGRNRGVPARLEPLDHGSPARAVVPVTVDEAERGYSGMFPCLRFGPCTRFVCSVSSALISFGRVSWGTITSSM